MTEIVKTLGRLFAAAYAYWLARLRMLGRCPPHRYEKDGQTFPFCLNCGEYREEAA